MGVACPWVPLTVRDPPLTLLCTTPATAPLTTLPLPPPPGPAEVPAESHPLDPRFGEVRGDLESLDTLLGELESVGRNEGECIERIDTEGGRWLIVVGCCCVVGKASCCPRNACCCCC